MHSYEEQYRKYSISSFKDEFVLIIWNRGRLINNYQGISF